MADSASISDSCSADGGSVSMIPSSPVVDELLQKRIDSLKRQNRVDRDELETFKLRVKALQRENRELRQANSSATVKHHRRGGRRDAWDAAEEDLMLEYLLKTVKADKEIEKPTRNEYWGRFIRLTGSKRTEEKLSSKHRNMKVQYKKALEWVKKADEGLLQDHEEETVRQYILKICPFFDKMDEIYGSKMSNVTSYQFQFSEKLEKDSQRDSLFDDVADEMSITVDVDDMDEMPVTVDIDDMVDTPKPCMHLNPAYQMKQCGEQESSDNRNKIMRDMAMQLKEAAAREAQVRREEIALREKELLQSKALEERRIALDQERLAFDRERQRDHKQIELERIASQERIEKYRIEMMYAKQ